MRSLKVNKDELLERLKLNKTKHYSLFLQAQEGYIEMLAERVAEMQANLRDNKGKELDLSIETAKPANYVGDYTIAIEMLEMSVDDIIELSQDEFNKYVMDNWQWSDYANTSNIMYASKTWK